jgi:hypothetical protein
VRSQHSPEQCSLASPVDANSVARAGQFRILMWATVDQDDTPQRLAASRRTNAREFDEPGAALRTAAPATRSSTDREQPHALSERQETSPAARPPPAQKTASPRPLTGADESCANAEPAPATTAASPTPAVRTYRLTTNASIG